MGYFFMTGDERPYGYVSRKQVKALVGDTLEEASYDLGASRLSTFRQVTLPRLAPAIFAGGLLAFTFSFDDVIISLFVQRPGTSTLPTAERMRAIREAYERITSSSEFKL